MNVGCCDANDGRIRSFGVIAPVTVTSAMLNGPPEPQVEERQLRSSKGNQVAKSGRGAERACVPVL